MATVRRELRNVSPGVVVSAAFTLDAVAAVGAQEILVGTYPMVPLIATGILLTAAGIHGVLAFAITRRAKEVAVRVAIGASRVDVLRLVAWQSVRLVGVGLAAGVGATYALTRFAQGQGGVFDSPGWEAFAVPVAIVLAVAAVASWSPSRRALRIEPVDLLRTN